MMPNAKMKLLCKVDIFENGTIFFTTLPLALCLQMQHPPQKVGIDCEKVSFLQTSTFTHDSVRIESKS